MHAETSSAGMTRDTDVESEPPTHINNEPHRRLDIHPEGEHILEAAEWHPPVASLRQCMGLEERNERSLAGRLKGKGKEPSHTLLDRLDDVPPPPDTVLNLLEAIAEELEQPRSNSEYWPWTGSLAHQPDVRQVVWIRTTTEIVLDVRDGPTPLHVPQQAIPRRNGFLYLDELSAIRAADWRHRHGPNSWEEFVLHAVGSGIPFEWQVPTIYLVAVNDAPAPPSWVHTDPVNEWWNHFPDDILASYLWAVQEVLSRPNAVCALHAGGLLWRIVVEYGDLALIESAVQGSSDMATVY